MVIIVILDKTSMIWENISHIIDPTPSFAYKKLWIHFSTQWATTIFNDPNVKNSGESSSSNFYWSSLYFWKFTAANEMYTINNTVYKMAKLNFSSEKWLPEFNISSWTTISMFYIFKWFSLAYSAKSERLSNLWSF